LWGGGKPPAPPFLLFTPYYGLHTYLGVDYNKSSLPIPSSVSPWARSALESQAAGRAGWGVCCNVYHILDVYHTPRCPLSAGTEFAGQRPALDVIYAGQCPARE